MSSMFKSMFGRGAQDLREMPEHIAEMDHIVCCAPSDIRIIIIKFYGSGGSFQDKCIILGFDRRTLRRRVDRADYYVNSQLDRLPEKDINSHQNGARRHSNPLIPTKAPAHAGVFIGAKPMPQIPIRPNLNPRLVDPTVGKPPPMSTVGAPVQGNPTPTRAPLPMPGGGGDLGGVLNTINRNPPPANSGGFGNFGGGGFVGSPGGTGGRFRMPGDNEVTDHSNTFNQRRIPYA